MIAKLTQAIKDSDQLSATKRSELRGDRRPEAGCLQVGTFTGPADTFRHRTETSKRQAAILKGP